MRLLIICASLCLVVENVYGSMTEAQVAAAQKMMRNMCQPKTKVPPAVVDNMRKGTFSEEKELKCYMECTLRTAQIMKDGKLNYQSASTQISNLPPSIANAALTSLDACKDAPKSADKCDAAYEFYKCFYDSNPTDFFLP